VPEGFAAAAPLLGMGTRRRTAIGIAVLTGTVEPPAALLAFAAGAMLYVVDELVPESHARGNERTASVALLAGFALMLVFDNVRVVTPEIAAVAELPDWAGASGG
jgi:ZIP family zinc transporter